MGKRAPTVGVARAFRVHDRHLRPLPGGQGETWSDGRLVLKPYDFQPAYDWVCDVYANWTSSDTVRVPEPVRSYDDEWLAEGWGALVLLPGRDAEIPSELDAVREAADAFQAAVTGLPRPGWMDDRHDPWAFGDRVAWEGAEPVGDPRTLGAIERVRAALRPVRSAFQVIHGDLLTNVVVAPRLPPGVIDWPPYFRPAALARAIAATDAVTFRGAPLSLLDDWATGGDWHQLVIRAILYRLATAGYRAARGGPTGSVVTDVERVESILDHVLAR